MPTALQTIETTAAAAVAAVEGFVNEVKTEGAKVIAWVEAEVPGAKSEIQALTADAESAAATLAQLAAADATGAISNLAADIETALANYASASKVPSSVATPLTQVETTAIGVAETIGKAAISVGLTKILGAVAPAVAAAL